MSDNSDDEGYITLNTPPPSPTAVIRLGNVANSSKTVSISQSPQPDLTTPTRKRRPLEDRPRMRSTAKLIPPPIAPDDDLEVAWDTAADELAVGSEPVWNSPVRPQAAREEFREEQDWGEVGAASDGYAAFCEAILEDGGAFYQISEELFVVHGWDAHAWTLKVREDCELYAKVADKRVKTSWHHLQRSIIGANAVTVCLCPTARTSLEHVCVHTRFLDDHGDEHFPVNVQGNGVGLDSINAVLFLRQELEDNDSLNVFSCPSHNSRSLNGRVFVEYTGDDSGSGKWICSKDRGMASCFHTGHCRNLLQQLLSADPDAQDEDTQHDPSNRLDYAVVYGRRQIQVSHSVSCLPVLPPSWASLDADPKLPGPFPTSETLRAAWFLYADLQHLDGSMQCPRCGPCPETTIWDGVTLAFNKKHVLLTLEPPTVSETGSYERSSTRYVPSQQIILNQKLRRQLRLVLTGKPLIKKELDKLVAALNTAETAAGSDSEEDDDDQADDATPEELLNPRGKNALEKARKSFLDWVDTIPAVVRGLSHLNEALGAIFDQQFGLAAEESILQLATRPALAALECFVSNPTRTTSSALTDIPVIHELLKYETGVLGAPAPNTIHVCEWILCRARITFASPLREPHQLPDLDGQEREKRWQEEVPIYLFYAAHSDITLDRLSLQLAENPRSSSISKTQA
ncbi:unnamed protein product [Mycena citricolor]|uniref:HMG domain-containing protein n=1 Tax=Mycena citricolor TaxID=2018698 RepID=A0AAD2JYB3_9AGAR|nr:unnamed protein product [Mycena citricolor]